jgi:hypothetical protein
MNVKLTTHEAADILLDDENANWSSAGSLAMVRYLEDLEEDLGEEIDLDVVAIGCDYSEFASLQSWLCEYYGADLHDALKRAGIDVDDVDDVDGWIRSHIQDHGTLIEFNEGIIVSSF